MYAIAKDIRAQAELAMPVRVALLTVGQAVRHIRARVAHVIPVRGDAPIPVPEGRVIPVPAGQRIPVPAGQSIPVPEGQAIPVQEGQTIPVREGQIKVALSAV
jgi:hypothetical protein